MPTWLIALCIHASTLTIAWTTADQKLAVPSADEQAKMLDRLHSTFPDEYADTSSAAGLAFAGKLAKAASEEKDNPKLRYVLLAEVVAMSIRGGNVEKALDVVNQIAADFDIPDSKEFLASKLADELGRKDLLEEYRFIAALELDKLTASKDIVELANKWVDLAAQTDSGQKIAAFRRGRQLVLRALADGDLKGLSRVEAGRLAGETAKGIDKFDEANEQFSLYSGIWEIKYATGHTLTVEITIGGVYKVLKAVGSNGVVYHPPAEQMSGDLTRRDGRVVASLGNGKLLERLTIDEDKLVAERFNKPSLYPKNPDNKGTGQPRTSMVELTKQAPSGWVLTEAKIGTGLYANRGYLFTALPTEAQGGTLLQVTSEERLRWIPPGKLVALGDGTVFAFVLWKYLGRIDEDEATFARFAQEGWTDVKEKVATTFPPGENWEWRAVKRSIQKGEVVLETKAIHLKGAVAFVFKSKSEDDRASLESIRDGNFIKPAPGTKPSSYLKIISSPGDFIGQGKSYSYEVNQIKSRASDRGLEINVEGWMICFSAPGGQTLAVGKYLNAKRFKFNGSAPGISLSFGYRGANRIGGKFVIWELELKGAEVTKLAVDFYQRAEETQPPAYGMLRVNSSFE